MSENFYYSYDRLMSYDGLFNFVLSGRGYGKSYGAKKRVINNFLKKGEQFMYVRRYKTELKKKHLFFDDICKEFPEHKFEVKGNMAYIDGKVGGHFVPLSTSAIEKSTSYPLVTTIVFDEFVIDKGNIRYLENEVENFLNLYETVARLREKEGKKPVKVLFLANKVSIVNPYFVYFNCVPKNDERFSVYKNGNIVIGQFTNEEFAQEKYKTRFGQLIKGTEFGDYSVDNKSLRDNNSFVIDKKPKNLEFLFSVIFKGREVGIWINYKQGFVYVSNDFLETSKNRFALTKEDMDFNYILFNRLSNFFLFKEVVNYFKNGLVRFASIDLKTHFFDIMKYMGT